MASKSQDISALYSKKVGRLVRYQPNQTNLVKLSRKRPKNTKNR